MDETMTFEQAVQRLDEIIKELDSGQIALEKSLELYAESAGFLAFCTKTLEEAELTIAKAFPQEREESDDPISK